jgi:hypothetical protein
VRLERKRVSIMKTIMRVRTIGPVVAVLIATFLLLAFQHRGVGQLQVWRSPTR